MQDGRGTSVLDIMRILRRYAEYRERGFRTLDIKLPPTFKGACQTLPLPATVFLCYQATNFVIAEYKQVKKLLDYVTKRRYKHDESKADETQISCMRRANTETACTHRATQHRSAALCRFGLGDLRNLFCGSR